MTGIQGTAIIRDRGQLTIPEKIRKTLQWSAVNAVVSLATTSHNELVIKPYEDAQKVDWSTIWTNIELTRTRRGKRGNLSSFIASDRGRH